MKTTYTAIIWILLFSYNSATADGIGCPKGTKPKGEQTPEVSEAWCDKSVSGKVVMHGPYRSWWPNGKLGTEGKYENGKQVGLLRGWYESGELQGEELFENGH
ncbi:MAG: hypothetical protein OEW15_18220 [Nitrospirota bacterium]|nr:hypothetical protein [Nitrospirota bacterium]